MKPHISRYEGFWRFQPVREGGLSCFFGTFRSLVAHGKARHDHVGV